MQTNKPKSQLKLKHNKARKNCTKLSIKIKFIFANSKIIKKCNRNLIEKSEKMIIIVVT